MKPRHLVACVACLFLAVPAAAQESEPSQPQTYKEQYEKYKKQAAKAIEHRWFVGGLFGVAFGSETSYAELSPIVSYRFNRTFQLGTRVTLRYQKDKRYEPDLSTTYLGGAILGRIFVYDPVYLQAEVERLNWEYLESTESGISTVKDTYTGLYAGFGFVQKAGGRVAMYMSFLWDFTYEKDEPSPNTNPWLIRIGFGVTF